MLTTARNEPEQLGRDFRGNAAKAVVALGGVLHHSDALTADLVYHRLGAEDFALVLTTRFNPVQCNAVIASVLGHHFLEHSPVLVMGGEYVVECPLEFDGLTWAGRFLRAADNQQASEVWRQRAMRGQHATGEPS